jgi:hypothetical protein
MTDDEQARQLVERFRNGHSDHTGVAIEDEAFLCEIIAAAFAALREECATECREDTAALRRDRDMLWGQVFERDKIIDGLRTAQPAAINVPGLGRLTASPDEGEWTDEAQEGA